MKRPLLLFLAVLAGLVAWTAIAIVGNFQIRALIPGYTAVEPSMAFTTPMLFSRLALAFVSTCGAGAICATAARSDKAAGVALATTLLVVFVPMHISLWNKFPIWYHLVFLASLAPLALAGFKLASAKKSSA